MKKKMPMAKEDAFIREVSEELKSDNMRLVWKKYGLYITLVIVLILTAAVSFETIKTWRVKGHQNWSDEYAIALGLQSQGKYEESLKVLERIANSGHDIYADIAKLQISNIYFEQGKSNEAISKLQEIVTEKDVNEELYHVAAIKLATYKLDYAPYPEVYELLEPMLGDKVWDSVAKELLALLEVREGNFERAREIYTEILDSGKLDENLSSRVKDMLSVLGSEQN